MNLHGRIMNLPASGEPAGGSMAYKLGHRDARHAAAEMAKEADALIAELTEALAVFVDFPADTFLGEEDGPFTLTARLSDMRQARAALTKAKDWQA